MLEDYEGEIYAGFCPNCGEETELTITQDEAGWADADLLVLGTDECGYWLCPKCDHAEFVDYADLIAQQAAEQAGDRYRDGW